MNPQVSNLGNFKRLALVLAFGLSLNSARSVTVDVGLDQLALIYTSNTFGTEISAGSIQIGRLGDSITEGGLAFSSRAAFDTFLGSANWSRYGAEVNYRPGDLSASYTFTNHFEAFVKNYNLTGEDPYQVYVAIRSGADLFGLFTFRGDDGGVGKFALTADDSPIFSLANEGLTGGLLNLEVVGSFGALRVADYGDSAIDPAIALIPEPSTGSLLLGSLGFYLAFASARKLQQKS